MDMTDVLLLQKNDSIREETVTIVLIILCAAFAAAFLYYGSKEKYVHAVAFKGLASACFVIMGLILNPGTNTANLIVTGLLAGCIADIVIDLRKVFAKKGQTFFLLGCLFFFAGHIMYILAVFPMSTHKALCVAIAVIVTPPLMLEIYKHITANTLLKAVGIVYIGAVMLLNCAAINNLIDAPSAFTGVFSAGALLFMASDILLVFNTFGAQYSQKVKNFYIGLYYAGQILIALSLQYLS